MYIFFMLTKAAFIWSKYSKTVANIVKYYYNFETTVSILLHFKCNLLHETIERLKEQYLFETEIFCNITHDFSFFLS